MKRYLAPLLLLAIGCASPPAYIPEERSTTTLAGRTAAEYGIPSEADRRGDLRLASFGLVDAETKRGKTKAVHVRLSLANDNGDGPMVIVTGDQRLQTADGQQLAPGYVQSDQDGLPVVSVQPGSSRTVDLFFAIPERYANGDKPPRFDVVWRVEYGGVLVTQVTPFERVSVDPAVASQQAAEAAAYYWYDPWWGPWAVGPYWWW